MTKLCLVKTDAPLPTGPVMDQVRAFLFGILQGLSDSDRRAWNRFWAHVKRMEPGELFNLEVIFPRNSKFHRRFFKMLSVGFDAWEPGRKHKTYKGQPVAKSFESFREECLILAGHYEQSFDLNGRLKLVAKSISFASMDDHEFEVIYYSVADVLLDKVLTTYKDRDELDIVVEKLLRFL